LVAAAAAAAAAAGVSFSIQHLWGAHFFCWLKVSLDQEKLAGVNNKKVVLCTG
jgi:hypothetical protein